jgi:hypothetical protein
MEWIQSTPGFDFALDESGAHFEGTLERETIGMERMALRTGSEQWRATTVADGVRWERKEGDSWVVDEAPVWGGRVFQRLTLPLDPQKREGSAQRIDTADGLTHYRFTNANSGEQHDVWIDPQGRISRMTIGGTTTLVVTNPK